MGETQLKIPTFPKAIYTIYCCFDFSNSRFTQRSPTFFNLGFYAERRVFLCLTEFSSKENRKLCWFLNENGLGFVSMSIKRQREKKIQLSCVQDKQKYDCTISQNDKSIQLMDLLLNARKRTVSIALAHEWKSGGWGRVWDDTWNSNATKSIIQQINSFLKNFLLLNWERHVWKGQRTFIHPSLKRSVGGREGKVLDGFSLNSSDSVNFHKSGYSGLNEIRSTR